MVARALKGAYTMLFRKSEKEIVSWIHSSKTALLVSGARQVGKTWSIRNSLRSEGCDFLEINLIEDPELVPALARCNSVEALVVILSTAKNYCSYHYLPRIKNVFRYKCLLRGLFK